MIKILFICHGNICRSPMAEYILKDRIKKNNLDVCTASRATSFEEIGNDIYPPVKTILNKYHISYDKHSAKRITQKDYDSFDLIYVMDSNNMRNILKIVNDKDNKIRKLQTFDIEDPWYTDNYEKVFAQIEQGVEMIIKKINVDKNINQWWKIITIKSESFNNKENYKVKDSKRKQGKDKWTMY